MTTFPKLRQILDISNRFSKKDYLKNCGGWIWPPISAPGGRPLTPRSYATAITICPYLLCVRLNRTVNIITFIVFWIQKEDNDENVKSTNHRCCLAMRTKFRCNFYKPTECKRARSLRNRRSEPIHAYGDAID